jgi:hypothetical protein
VPTTSASIATTCAFLERTDNCDDLAAYLKAEPRPGDIVWFWSFPVFCTATRALWPTARDPTSRGAFQTARPTDLAGVEEG